MALPQWKGLFEWSMKHNDGTRPSNFRPEDLDHAKMKWLENVMNSLIQDPTVRMREIKAALDTGRAPLPQATAGNATDAAAPTATPDAAADGAVAGAAAGTGSSDADDGARDVTSRGQPQPDQERQPGELTVEEREGLLEELMDIVTSIDLARDFFKLGGLATLNAMMQSPHPGLRWRAAEVVATCAANNPPVQQWLLDGAVLPRLMDLLRADATATAGEHSTEHSTPASSGAAAEVATCRVKALLALSALVRQFPAGLEAFRLAGGLLALIKASGAPDVKVCRKALGLLQYVLTVHAADSQAACQLGAVGPVAAALSRGIGSGSDGSAYDSDDGAVREAALSVVIELLQHEGSWAAVSEAFSSGPAAGTLHRIRELHAALSPEDKEASADELALLTQVEALLQRRITAASVATAADSHAVPIGAPAGGRQMGLIIR